jgi:hypothetical protein
MKFDFYPSAFILQPLSYPYPTGVAFRQRRKLATAFIIHNLNFNLSTFSQTKNLFDFEPRVSYLPKLT